MGTRLAAMTVVLAVTMLAPAEASDRTAAHAVIRVRSLPAQVIFVRFSSIDGCHRELPGLKRLADSEFRASRLSRRDVIAPHDLPDQSGGPQRVEGECRVLPGA